MDIDEGAQGLYRDKTPTAADFATHPQFRLRTAKCYTAATAAAPPVAIPQPCMTLGNEFVALPLHGSPPPSCSASFGSQLMAANNAHIDPLAERSRYGSLNVPLSVLSPARDHHSAVLPLPTMSDSNLPWMSAPNTARHMSSSDAAQWGNLVPYYADTSLSTHCQLFPASALFQPKGSADATSFSTFATSCPSSIGSTPPSSISSTNCSIASPMTWAPGLAVTSLPVERDAEGEAPISALHDEIDVVSSSLPSELSTSDLHVDPSHSTLTLSHPANGDAIFSLSGRAPNFPASHRALTPCPWQTNFASKPELPYRYPNRPATAPHCAPLPPRARQIISDVVSAAMGNSSDKSTGKMAHVAKAESPGPTQSSADISGANTSLLRPFVSDHQPLDLFSMASHHSGSHSSLSSHKAMVAHSEAPHWGSPPKQRFKTTALPSKAGQHASHATDAARVGVVTLSKVARSPAEVFTPMFGTPGRAVSESESLKSSCTTTAGSRHDAAQEAGDAHPEGPDAKRRRPPRAIVACEPCRQAKRRCDGLSPCAACRRKRNFTGKECIYSTSRKCLRSDAENKSKRGTLHHQRRDSASTETAEPGPRREVLLPALPGGSQSSCDVGTCIAAPAAQPSADRLPVFGLSPDNSHYPLFAFQSPFGVSDPSEAVFTSRRAG